MPWVKESFPPRRQPHWLHKFNLFWALCGNDDDGYFGDDHWRAGRAKTFWLAAQWWFRNPFHNLFFYVVGVGDRQRTFWSRSDRLWGTVDGWTFHWLKASGVPIYFPFASFQNPRISAYVGWRPYGAFGFKFQIKRKG